jgi:hypothetical protein
VVLLTQSLPYLAAVTVSLVAAFPARAPRAATADSKLLAQLAPGD